MVVKDFHVVVPPARLDDARAVVATLGAEPDRFPVMPDMRYATEDPVELVLAGTDELIHILDGTAILEIVCDDGPPQSFALRAGMMAVIPQGAWHRFHSSEGVTLMTATPFLGEKIDLDVADPRMVEPKPA
ncbi:MAG: hypothetical protein ACREKH_09585 [Candidatus Rokuibacteriota bacterium]